MDGVRNARGSRHEEEERVVTVVKELGATLAKAFPRGGDDGNGGSDPSNELPDHVRLA